MYILKRGQRFDKNITSAFLSEFTTYTLYKASNLRVTYNKVMNWITLLTFKLELCKLQISICRRHVLLSQSTLHSPLSMQNGDWIIYLPFCKSNWAEGYSVKNFGSSVSEVSIAGIAIYTSSVENGMLQ